MKTNNATTFLLTCVIILCLLMPGLGRAGPQADFRNALGNTVPTAGTLADEAARCDVGGTSRDDGQNESDPALSAASCGARSDIPVLAHHVRYRLGLFNWEENPDFAFWEQADGKKASRERIWISEVWKPEPSRIRNVVFIVAGQQGSQYTWGAEANIGTGQSKGWRGSREALTHTVPIRGLSVAGLIYEDGVFGQGQRYGFRPDDTLFILVFDAAFYYGLNPSNKQKLEEGYHHYLLDRMGSQPANVETIFMAGASRGGALICGLAKRFMDDSSPVGHAKILLATLDGVAHAREGECGTSTATITNPLNRHYRAYQATLSEYFGNPGPKQLSMYQVVGGAKVVFLQEINPARAFINVGTATFDYEFAWVNRKHQEIGRPWHDDCSGAVLKWLEGKRNQAGDAPADRLW